MMKEEPTTSFEQVNARRTVLIVDDDVDFLALMSHIVSRAGYNVVKAIDIKMAIAALKSEDILVVLTDVQLPDGNGLDLTQLVKAAYPFREVIVMTSHGKISDGVKAIKYGAYDYLEKGEDEIRLTELLKGATEKALLQLRIAELNSRLKDVTTKQDEGIIMQNLTQIGKVALIIKAINSSLRQQMMQIIIQNGKINVKEICSKMNLPQAIVSQHLIILKDANLVNVTRVSKNSFYSANYTSLEKVIAFVHNLLS